MVVGSAGDESISKLLEGNLERLGILDDLLLVGLKVIGLSLLEGNSESSDGVVVGSTLVAGEDGEVDRTLKVIEGFFSGLRVGLADALTEEDHGTTGSTKGLVCGGSDDIAVREGRLVHTSSNKTGDVSHIHQKVGANLVGDFAHAGVVDLAAVGRSSGHQDLGSVHERILFELIVVDEAGLEVDAVREGLEVSRDGGDPMGGQQNARHERRGGGGGVCHTCAEESGIRGTNDHREADPDP